MRVTYAPQFAWIQHDYMTRTVMPPARRALMVMVELSDVATDADAPDTIGTARCTR